MQFNLVNDLWCGIGEHTYIGQDPYSRWAGWGARIRQSNIIFAGKSGVLNIVYALVQPRDTVQNIKFDCIMCHCRCYSSSAGKRKIMSHSHSDSLWHNEHRSQRTCFMHYEESDCGMLKFNCFTVNIFKTMSLCLSKKMVLECNVQLLFITNRLVIPPWNKYNPTGTSPPNCSLITNIIGGGTSGQPLTRTVKRIIHRADTTINIVSTYVPSLEMNNK